MTGENPLSFNVMTEDGQVLCPCCGFAGQFAREPNGRGGGLIGPYGPLGGIIGSGICSCCYWEPGFDDDPMASAFAKSTIIESLRAYRDAWVSAGYVWRGANSAAPVGWDGRTHCEAFLQKFPHLT